MFDDAQNMLNIGLGVHILLCRMLRVHVPYINMLFELATYYEKHKLTTARKTHSMEVVEKLAELVLQRRRKGER